MIARKLSVICGYGDIGKGRALLADRHCAPMSSVDTIISRSLNILSWWWHHVKLRSLERRCIKRKKEDTHKKKRKQQQHCHKFYQNLHQLSPRHRVLTLLERMMEVQQIHHISKWNLLQILVHKLMMSRFFHIPTLTQILCWAWHRSDIQANARIPRPWSLDLMMIYLPKTRWSHVPLFRRSHHHSLDLWFGSLHEFNDQHVCEEWNGVGCARGVRWNVMISCHVMAEEMGN